MRSYPFFLFALLSTPAVAAPTGTVTVTEAPSVPIMVLGLGQTLFLVFLAGALVSVALRLLSDAGKTFANYRRRKTLFSPAERSFLGVLEQAAGDKARIFGKVRVADLIEVDGGDRSARASAFNKIARKHVDFVLCDPETLEVLGCVELDDASHSRARRIERDRFLDAAMESAGIPLKRVPAKRGYQIDQIRKLLDFLPDRNERVTPGNQEVPATPGEQRTKSQEGESSRECPSCGKPLVIRTARRGQYQGRQFLACPDYPKCRYIASTGDR